MFEKIKELIMQYVEVEEDQVTPEARFIEDLNFNSYDFMSFLGEVEEEFDVQVEESEVLNLHTVGDAVEYLKTLKED